MEFNPFQKRFRKGKRRVALVYPNRYVGGIANIGLQLLYAKINEFAHCERFYSDVFDGLRSLESGSRLNEFEIAMFSLHYEKDYFKALEIIKRSGFRGIKIAGGPCVMENPRPLMPFFDAFFIGEAEDRVEEIIEARSVEELSDIDGIFTGKEEKVKRVFCRIEKHIEDEIIGEGAYGKCFLIEIGRGCVRRCSFCLVRQIYFPPRWRNLEDFPEIRGVNKVALIAPSPTDHPQFKDILQKFVERGFEISPSSLRADAVDEELVEILKAGKVKTLTLAPETSSPKLSEFLKKEISFEDLRNAVEISAKAFEKLKLYYLIGIPGELEEDVKKIVEDVVFLKKFIQRVEISVNPLVPKPHTPLQWIPFAKIPELKRKISLLFEECKKHGIEVSLPNLREFVIQSILARGDESLSEMVAGNRNYREYLHFLKGYRLEEALPWDFIDHGYKKSKLLSEFLELVEILDKSYKSMGDKIFRGR
ncbi:MAG: radical SAM protein [Archaeoglobaceae archaeon]|nr:B12-binding domain-containing radical SAM protein [Archaeoglobaceae archaeon]MDW7989916.1 radical SAM protein [Archaeoglobaceae archaeon]